METEKITINLGAIDLGQIDLLVDQGFYSNRTDFIRTAIRQHLASHGKDIEAIKAANLFGVGAVRDASRKVSEAERQLEKELSTAVLLSQGFTGTGLLSLSVKELEEVRLLGRKIKIRMIGMLIIDKKVSAELAREVFETVKVYGMIKASDEVKQVLDALQ